MYLINVGSLKMVVTVAIDQDWSVEELSLDGDFIQYLHFSWA